jgi:[acyl-carrier-protein] S-malonyltransferase
MIEDGLPPVDKKRIAAIFPAFGCKYLGNERSILDGMSTDLRELLGRAGEAAGLSGDMLAGSPYGDFGDELVSQYAVYLYSCAASNAIKRAGVHSDYAAGYSMGLYAALYHAESITFEQGLECIRVAYDLIRSDAATRDFGMVLISGLPREDVEELVSRYGDLEIINANNRHSFLVAGYDESVRGILTAAKAAGALNTQHLAFRSPYHSRFMNEAARQFRDYCSGIRIFDPIYRIVSSVDRRVIETGDEVLTDLADNINCAINWHETMSRMIAYGVDAFIECGPGKSLYKMAKFIDGDFDVYYLHTINNLLSSGRICSHADALKG